MYRIGTDILTRLKKIILHSSVIRKITSLVENIIKFLFLDYYILYVTSGREQSTS